MKVTMVKLDPKTADSIVIDDPGFFYGGGRGSFSGRVEYMIIDFLGDGYGAVPFEVIAGNVRLGRCSIDRTGGPVGGHGFIYLDEEMDP